MYKRYIKDVKIKILSSSMMLVFAFDFLMGLYSDKLDETNGIEIGCHMLYIFSSHSF
jgi:hypothetical protein